MLAGQIVRDEAEEARALLENEVSERPEDLFARTGLAWVYLALGRKSDALSLAQKAADSLTIEKDAVLGPTSQIALAEVEAWADQPENATKRLRHLLSIPASLATPRVKIDPIWDPIRNHPDFQKLLTGPELIGPNK